MKKKLCSMVLVSVMTASMLAGCGSSAGNDTAAGSSSASGAATSSGAEASATTAAAETTSAAASSEAAASAASSGTDLSKQDPYTVRIVADGPCSDEACKEVSEAVSKITKAKFNTEVELVRYDFGTYTDQVQTELASGEKIDLLGGVSSLSIPAMASQGQVLALDDLLASDGQGILSDISKEDLASTSVGGKVYAVRNNKELGLGLGFVCNTEMLDSLGVDYSNITTEKDMEPILEAVKKKYPDVYPWGSDSGNLGDYMLPIDWLGRDFGVLLDSFDDSDTTVVNFYTSDAYKELCENRYKWNQAGLIMKDASISTDSVSSLMGAGKVFCATTETKPGIEAQWERNTGVDCTVINIVPDYTMTSNLNNYWFIPYTSEQPERAMQILNEMYTNPDVANLFIYGIEGKDYVYTDKANDLIDYPEGASSESLGWTITAWHFPNELIAHKWASDGADIWKDTIKFNKECHPSQAKGFVWDSTSVTNEIAACTTVLNKYKKGLDTGDVDPDSVWDEMTAEYKEAGIDKIITEKQKQLDDWLAANK